MMLNVGDPGKAVTDVNIDIAEQIKEEWRLSLWKLSRILNVLLESDHHIVTVELGIS
jgi:uncharacterized protein YjaG (DUF416 family)